MGSKIACYKNKRTKVKILTFYPLFNTLRAKVHFLALFKVQKCIFRTSNRLIFALQKDCIMNKAQPKASLLFNSDIYSPDQVTALAFDMAAINGDFELIINSPGGDVFTGTALAALITDAVNNGRKIKTTGIGLVASSASFMLLAGSEVSLQENAFLMVHEPISFSFGTKKRLQKDAETLSKVEEMIVSIYANKMARTKGKKIEDARREAKKYIKDETWFSAQKALEVGLIDSIDTSKEPVAPLLDFTDAENRTDVSTLINYAEGFRKAPRQFLNQFNMPPMEKKQSSSFFSRLTNLFSTSNKQLENLEKEAEALPIEEEKQQEVPMPSMKLEEMIDKLEKEGYAVMSKEEQAETISNMAQLKQRIEKFENKQATQNLVTPNLGSQAPKPEPQIDAKARASFDFLANKIKNLR